MAGGPYVQIIEVSQQRQYMESMFQLIQSAGQDQYMLAKYCQLVFELLDDGRPVCDDYTSQFINLSQSLI